jgi:hypothetical protein
LRDYNDVSGIPIARIVADAIRVHLMWNYWLEDHGTPRKEIEE